MNLDHTLVYKDLSPTWIKEVAMTYETPPVIFFLKITNLNILSWPIAKIPRKMLTLFLLMRCSVTNLYCRCLIKCWVHFDERMPEAWERKKVGEVRVRMGREGRWRTTKSFHQTYNQIRSDQNKIDWTIELNECNQMPA